MSGTKHKITALKIVFLTLLMLFLLCSCAELEMSDAEYRAYRASLIHSYDVCSVHQYVLPKTNQFGKITGSSLCYAFTYATSNGVLKTVNQFEHFEYGLTKVCIGDRDKYVVDESTGIRYLYLSEDTLNNLS